VTQTSVAYAPPAEARLVRALRAGDQEAFGTVVTRYTPAMTRTALFFVADRAVAEEVVQEAWVAVLRGLDGFKERSSFKTWVFRIVSNLAKSRGARERRSMPFSALAFDREDGEVTADADRFLADGHWTSAPRSWSILPEERAVSREVLDVVRDAVEELPPNQRAVVVLRDVEGWPPDDVCSVLEVSEANQRVLLHRGRARVRRALDAYFAT
jgi:RNA polymerase sigma-70 factor (ECF subfamily)